MKHGLYRLHYQKFINRCKFKSYRYSVLVCLFVCLFAFFFLGRIKDGNQGSNLPYSRRHVSGGEGRAFWEGTK